MASTIALPSSLVVSPLVTQQRQGFLYLLRLMVWIVTKIVLHIQHDQNFIEFIHQLLLFSIHFTFYLACDQHSVISMAAS